MKRYVVALCALVALACAQDEQTRSGGNASADESPGRLAQGKAERHDASHDGRHRLYRPDQLQWKDGPPSLPPGAKFAVLEGDPSQSGFFAMRLRLPDGYRIPPHTHPVVERVTVVSGTFHLGMGGQADWQSMQELPAGSYVSMQPGMQHYARASGETVVQLATVGPWGITYVNPADDPRRKSQK